MQEASVEALAVGRTAHAASAEDLAGALSTDISTGLSSAEAEARLARYGPNALPEAKGRTLAQAFVEQLNNFLMILLLAATALAAAIGEFLNAGTIAAIVFLSVVLGVAQEWRAERAVQALKAMMAPTARVVRDGRVREVAAPSLVPGDTVLLEVGNYVPAGLRLVEAANLTVNEASLTGESTPVRKDPSLVLAADTVVADRRNCAFTGTLVTYGRARGIVTATGSSTEMGRIATLISTYEEEETPLQRRMSGLGRWLGWAAIAISVLIFVVGSATGKDLVDMLLTAVTLAVAAVPEGLPAVVAIALSLGTQRMARRNTLMRRLSAVETLGSATVIASDKTGTLTKGEMTVVRVHLGAGLPSLEVTGAGYEPKGDFRRNGRIVDPRQDRHLGLLLTAAAQCNDARLQEEDARWQVVGDTTEGALAVLAAKAGLSQERLEQEEPRQGELPFSPDRRRMTTVHRRGDRFVAYHKGAPDVVLPLCSSWQVGDEIVDLPDGERERILTANDELGSRGLRVLAIAYRPLEQPLPEAELELDMVFLGLAAIQDPPRPEVRDAVAVCHEAGIQPVMITGDHAATAEAIARDLKISGPEDAVLTGADLGRMDEDELQRSLDRVHVFARISPEQKVRIVEALREKGNIVAVTGDGVNDAPALKRADIGVAMGITGTDVAKEAADVIITDDNFASIVAAVEEGRKIFDNIRNFTVYLLGANVGEILVIFVAVVGTLPLPLLPMHILWVNLITDSLPALALSMEPGDPDAMKRPARPPEEPVVTRPMASLLALRGVVEAAAVLTAFILWWQVFDASVDKARTIAFATIVVAELLMAFGSRSLYRTIVGLGPLRNRHLVVGVLISFGMLLAVLYVPPLQEAFHTEVLGLGEWLAVAGLGCLPLLVIEGRKLSPWRLRP
ncbi:MAG: cation-translocating P-type ATPase [Dehalococcoidia bacterium]|nr:MAG: cation-translocating P-type ATPase [Dehalococcoidia bacterium]